MNDSARALRLGLKGFHGVAEDVMIARDIELAYATGGHVHICHVSTARGVELIRRAKNDGIKITSEVTPHHLVLTEDSVDGLDTNYKMMPPLRTSQDLDALVAGIKDGTIDAIASDHAPHDLDSKRVEFSKATVGILGLQTSLPLLMEFVRDGKISRSRMVDLLSSGPARSFSLPYGTLKKGAIADLVICNPEKKWSFDQGSIQSISKNSPFIGREMQGSTEQVFVNGCRVVLNGKLVAENRI